MRNRKNFARTVMKGLLDPLHLGRTYASDECDWLGDPKVSQPLCASLLACCSLTRRMCVGGWSLGECTSTALGPAWSPIPACSATPCGAPLSRHHRQVRLCLPCEPALVAVLGHRATVRSLCSPGRCPLPRYLSPRRRAVLRGTTAWHVPGSGPPSWDRSGHPLRGPGPQSGRL